MKKYSFPRWNELPEIDLYMDQILTYLTDHLSCISFSEEKIVTSSMINNYVKAGLVNPPVKKHYSRTHIAYFMAVMIMKKCYSLKEIDALITIQTHMDHSEIEEAYDLFIDRFESSLNHVFQSDYDQPAFHAERKEQVLMDHVIQSIIHKIYSEYALSFTDVR